MRQLGNTDINITPVAMGCWPIAGMTSLDVNDTDSLATLHAAIDRGINFFDTAYCYGANGESERLIARILGTRILGTQGLGDRRDEIVIATKGGIHWRPDGTRVFDASPDRLKIECDESLQRLDTDRVELLYLHAPDPNVPVADSAGALKELMDAGKTRCVGVSNFSVEQLEQFHAVCPVSAVQPPYNLLQREIESDIIPWCLKHNASCIIYWPLLKGLLAGKLKRDHVFRQGDGRPKYPMFQGEQWEKNQDFVDDLRQIASAIDKTVAELVVAWTIAQPGITAALCGAKRATQIEETADGMGWELDAGTTAKIEEALLRRGEIVSKPAV